MKPEKAHTTDSNLVLDTTTRSTINRGTHRLWLVATSLAFLLFATAGGALADSPKHRDRDHKSRSPIKRIFDHHRDHAKKLRHKAQDHRDHLRGKTPQQRYRHYEKRHPSERHHDYQRRDYSYRHHRPYYNGPRHDGRYDYREHSYGYRGHRYFAIPRVLVDADLHLYNSYHHSRVYYAPHKHYHVIYRFPVYVDYGVEYRPYAYCEDKFFAVGSFGPDGGVHFDLNIRF